jgi:putative transposase
MRKKQEFEIGQQYHLYARGVDKRDTFLEEKDYLRFMALLYTCNTANLIRLSKVNLEKLSHFKNIKLNPIIQLDQFCLMPNHFHILCTEIIDGGISKFMQKVLTGYTVFFNKKYKREGRLFSSRFKIKHINNDLYIEYIKKYIYFNPLKIIKQDYESKDFLLYETKYLQKEERDFLDEYLYKG